MSANPKDTRNKFQCPVCGKISAGRLPRINSRHVGDTSFRYPRRHQGANGKPCPGNIEEAIWL